MKGIYLLAVTLVASCATSAPTPQEQAKLPSMGAHSVYEVDVEELSGLCFNTDRTILLSCGDQGVVKSITFDGKVSTLWEYDADMEGITLDPNTGDIYLAIEGRQEVHKLSAPGYTDQAVLFAVKEAVENKYKNDGLEAVEYYKDGILFVGSQKNANLWQYRLNGEMISKVSLSSFATEIAGLHYESEEDLLWVTDSNVAKIYLCSPEGEKLAEYSVPFVKNLESICVDRKRGCVWGINGISRLIN